MLRRAVSCLTLRAFPTAVDEIVTWSYSAWSRMSERISRAVLLMGW